MRLPAVPVSASLALAGLATLAAAAEGDNACYFHCAARVGAANNSVIFQDITLNATQTQCLTQQDSAAIFRCACADDKLKGAINYCMFQTCKEEQDAEDGLLKQKCDISDSKLNNILHGTNGAAASAAFGGAAWLAVLGALLLA